MRTLTDTLKKAQQVGALTPLYKIVLTKGTSTYTYGNERILPSEHDEEMYSHRARIVLNNSKGEFNDIDLKGYDAVIFYGIGKEHSATAPLVVIDQQFDSTPNKLTCILELVGTPNLMAEDEAATSYVPDEEDNKTVKELVNAIVKATLPGFTHCKKFEVVWDEGYDTLADTYKPKDGFRIYTRGKRLAALRRVLDYTANVPRFEADGKVHILKPVTTGTDYDYEYSLERGHHTFFRKAYRNSLVIPNRICVMSYEDDDPKYLGVAVVEDFNSLSEKVRKTAYIQAKLESNEQADSIAEALIAKAKMGSARGDAEVPLNVGAEVFDYVKVTDQRQGDTRTGNLGYVHRRFGPDKWIMTFGFGNWLDMLRYRHILKELETYTDAGQYFNRLGVKNLYAENIRANNLDMVWIDPDGNIDLSKIGDTLDNLPDGEVYARVKTTNIQAGLIKLDEYIIYKPGYNPTTKFDLDQDTLDRIPEGVTFKRVRSAALSAAGMVLMDEIIAGTYGKIRSLALDAAGMVMMDRVVEGTYGRIKRAALSADGLVLMDQTVDGTYGKLLTTDIAAGHIKLTSYAQAVGGWYDKAGVAINADSGIIIYGPGTALRTRATKTGADQCYVGSDGAIYAAAGNIKLNNIGLHIYGSDAARFYDTNSILRGLIFGSTLTQFTIRCQSSADLVLDANSGSGNLIIYGKNMLLPSTTSEPSKVAGRMYYNTSTGQLCICATAGGTLRWWDVQLTNPR